MNCVNKIIASLSVLWVFALTMPSVASAATYQVTYNGTTFSPGTLAIQAGDTVTWTNQSTGTLNFASDPHPTHTDHPELNLGVISPNGGSDSYTFITTGNYGYHNHVLPSAYGSVSVSTAVATPTPTPVVLSGGDTDGTTELQAPSNIPANDGSLLASGSNTPTLLILSSGLFLVGMGILKRAFIEG